MAGLAASPGMTGLEFIQALFSGKLPGPPILATMGFEAGAVEEGRVTFFGEPGEYLYNPIGVVHGGYAMTLLDSAMGCAVQTMLKVDEAYTTLETKVNFVRPITLETGRLRCDGTVVYRGGKVATADGRVVALQTEKLLAHGTSTCLLLQR